MKFKNFTYKKKKDGETKNYLVLQLEENESHLKGIDLTKLDEKEVQALFDIQKEYESKMIPFVKKAYRVYIKENITDENNISDPEQLLNS